MTANPTRDPRSGGIEKPMISIRGLSLSINGEPILKNVSLSLDEGRVTGLVGESGSGKSMTALALMGLPPRGSRIDGRIDMFGSPISDLPEAEFRKLRGNQIGMIFQEPMTALNPVRNIGDQVAETLVTHGAATRSEALAAARGRLDRVGLPEGRFPLSLYPHELSGGQRQRVCVALAIALRPRLLIADEPTTALDVTTQARILDLLKGLVDDEGMGLLLITHDLAVVSGIADRTAVMEAGRVVEDAPTGEIFTKAAHPLTRSLIAASTHVPDRPPGTPGAPLLTVEDAVREYVAPRRSPFSPARRTRAVDGVCFTLRRGENLGLVGESGCGKSTLARAVLGLDPLRSGRIALNGEAIEAGRVPYHIRRRMQAVFQDPHGSFNPRHRVERLIAEPFHLTPSPPRGAARREAVAEALKAVHLSPSDAGKYIHEFSGGQRQRIAIARALITRPDLIILDEAVSSLDVSVRARILDLLAELSESHGLSYLFIGHDLSVVRAVTDRVLVMRSGKIVEEGESARVLESPSHPHTRELVDSSPRITRA